MASRAPEGAVTIGVFNPYAQLVESGQWDGVVATIKAVDPRVTVIGEQYSEPHAVRVLRRSLDPEAARGLTPELTEPQLKALAAVDVAIALDLPPEVASHAPNLRWVQSYGAGTAHLLAAGLVEAGIVLTSGAGVNATGIAEFAVARVLQHWKAFRTFDDMQSRRHWDHYPTRELAASTVGLIGLGAINGAVAARLHAFDVRVLATRRSAARGDTAPNVDQLYPADDLHTMLGQCDAVVAAVPGTVETEQLMEAGAFAAMKPGAFFVNVGRGSLVDEPALIDALRSGHLSGAALDVMVNEPMPADDPLWDAPNLYLSPHSATAGGSLWPNLLKLFCENLRRYLAGEDLLNEVDPDRGY